MSGLDKIKDRILSDAEKKASEKMEEAGKEAETIKSEAVREADKLSKDIKAKAEQDAESYGERVGSSIDLERRTKILAAKQEMIKGVIEEAGKKIMSLDDKEYFGLLLRLVEKNARAEKGELCLSREDLAKVPEGFDKAVQDAARAKGGDLVISKEARDTGRGFILNYGGIEENCTFDALFESRKDDFQDIVQTILFS